MLIGREPAVVAPRVDLRVQMRVEPRPGINPEVVPRSDVPRPGRA
ncbi:MAG: hypothetical protein JWQ18_2421 [Conexibacter sp.]|nr:hypothetical protein [Conexibacter sp.]